MNYLAIDIGGTFIKYAVITESAEIISKGKKPTDRTAVLPITAAGSGVLRILRS